MNIKGKYSWYKHLDFMVINTICFFASFLLSYYLVFHSLSFYHNNNWVIIIVVSELVNIIVMLLMNPFSGISRRPNYKELICSIKIITTDILIISVILYLLRIGELYSREVILLMYLIYGVLSCVADVLWKKIAKKNNLRLFSKINKLLVVTESEKAEEVLRSAESIDYSVYDIVGLCVEDENSVGKKIDDVGIVTSINNLVEYAITNNIDDVYFELYNTHVDSSIYDKLNLNGIRIHINIYSIVGIETDDQFVSRVGINKSLSVGFYSFSLSQQIYLGIKRIADIIIGLIGCVLLLPISLVIKVSYLLHGDKASIFYSHNRVGKDGRIIKLYKFRSMLPNADEILQELLKDEKYRIEWEENQKFEDDPRITGLGKVLRKTSIDETPQFFNMLKGDMSLVGPRPLVVGELEQHHGLKLYQKVKPGITGWWACNGRSNIDYKERLELEYYYVKNCSFELDMLCIIRTVVSVLKREGAK